MSLHPPTEGGSTAEPPLDLDQLMGTLRREVEARKQRARDQAEFTTALAGSLEAVLAMPDAEFAAAAYHLALGRAPSEHEVGGSLNRLLLGRVTRTGLLREFVSSDEGRNRNAFVEGLERAEQRERASRGTLARLRLDLANTARTIRLLPKRIAQFVRRVEQLERKLADTNLRLDAVERELAATRAAPPLDEG